MGLVVVISGKKQAGKSSASRFITSQYINKCLDVEKTASIKESDDGFVNLKLGNKTLEIDNPQSPDSLMLLETFGVKIYSFADELKIFCINVLGLDPLQCYGTDDQKKTKTHVHWESIPENVRKEFTETNPKGGATRGYMSARQVMQVFGTNMCRKMDPNCWARATYNRIKAQKPKLAIIADARFPNEITMGTETGAKAIRLLRSPYNDKHESETALDNFPLGEYNLSIDNSKMDMEETHTKIWDFLKEVIK